jgi:PAS domain S-box-containing protein
VTTPIFDPAAADALLKEYGLPERAPVEQLRGITRVAATLCSVPHAVVNLLSGCFQHQVGEIGFDGGQSDLGDSMCSRAVREPGLRYLPDAAQEPAFAASPWVNGRMAAVRLYASAPMILPDGRVLGTLCVFSDRPGYLSEDQLDALKDLAGQAIALFDHTRLADEARRMAEESKALARELRLSEQQHKLIFDAAPVGMVEADADGRILAANTALVELLGYDDPGRLAGVLLPELTHPEERPEQAELLTRATYGHLDAWDSDRRMLRQDGSIVDTVISKRIVRTGDGEIHRMLVSVLDMSERAAARRALESANGALEQTNSALHTAIGALDEAKRDAEQHEALAAAVLETIDVGICACNAEGRLTMFNAAARRILGLDVDAGPDLSAWAQVYSLYDEDGETLLRPEQVPLARALREGEVSGATMVIKPPLGPDVVVRADGRALRVSGYGSLGAVVALTDITELRRHAEAMALARDEALAATRAKSAFLAAVSHEIRTPLNGMLGMLELLLLHDLDDTQRERAGIAHTSGRTLLALLNDILDLSRGEAHEAPLRPRPVDLARLARDVTDSMRGTAHLKHLEVGLDVGPDLPAAVLADADRLRQMLLNLLGNAVKFTDTGRVGLAVDGPEPGWVRFRVSDTGPGVTPEEATRLFQAFEQGAAGAAKGGTGLGLALCRQLAELMGGSITVDSRPGDTTFTVTLPLAAADPPSDEPLDGVGAGLHVLLVDDDRINRMVGSAMLTKLGAQVTLAEDGRAAVDAARSTPFDLVLMDRNMPEMDGLEATRALRADPATADLPIAALTGAGDDARQECLDAGMDHYLTKPVSLAVLEDLLHRVHHHPIRLTTAPPHSP